IRFDGTNLVNATLTLGIRTWADSPTIEPDGSIWFGGNFGTGLHRFDPGAGKTGAVVQSFARQDGLVAGAVFSTFRAGENLWIATFSGASRFDGTRFVNFTTADGLVANDVITVTVTPDGSIWFGTRTRGISKYDPQHFAQFDVADGLIAPNSPAGGVGIGGAALLAPDGALWFASGLWRDNQRGLVRYDGRGFEQIFSAFRNSINALALGKDNSIWLGLRGDGLLHYAKGRSRPLTQSDGLPGDDVASLA